jgi:hypothetical protein
MGSQVVAVIIGFTAGVVTPYLNSFLTERLERHKAVAQLASAAFVDFMHAMGENSMCHQVLETLGHSGPKEEVEHWQRRLRETRVAYVSAKARIASYGNAMAAHYLAEIERGGGFVGSDAAHQQLFAKIVLELRAELGLGKRTRISEGDVGALLFGG